MIPNLPEARDFHAAPRKPRALIADDDSRILELLQFVLAGNGFEVILASDGAEALAQVATAQPDLAVIDVKMPRRTGFDVLERIRAAQELAHIPVILISGSGDTEFRLAGLMKGADDFLVKPFSPKELLLKCRRLLERTEHHVGLRHAQVRLESEMERSRQDVLRLSGRLSREQWVKDTLVGLTRELNEDGTHQQILNSLQLTLVGQLNLGSTLILLPSEEDPGVFVPHASHGIPTERLRPLRFRATGPLISSMQIEGRPLRMKELGAWPDLGRECGLLQAAGISLVAPIVSAQGRLVALAALGERADGAEIPRDDLELLQSLCSGAGTSLETAQLFRDHQTDAMRTISALVEAMEAKDPFGRGHTARVAEYAVALAHALGLPQEEVEVIRVGALLHDIGKIGVQDWVIHKPNSLTCDEQVQMQAHPVIGAAILKHLRFLDAAQDIVRHHHERMDGKGYPDKIAGEALSLGARIVCVADSLDALSTHRPYRSALSMQETLAVLQKNAGAQYDPEVVRALVDEVRSGRIRILDEDEKAA